MISHEQAQELHALFGGPIETAHVDYNGDLEVVGVMVSVADLRRARELVAIIVADTEPQPADAVSYDPCITGTITANGESSEFMVALDPESSTRYSQWGAWNPTLWPRTDLLDGIATVAREWYIDNKEETDEGGIPDE